MDGELRHTKFHFRDPEAPKPTRPRVLGVMALIERDGLLLLERRSDAPMWSLIAGMVDDSESLTDALGREVMEETGLRVVSCSLFGTFSDPTRIVSYADGNVYRVASVVYSAEVESFDALQPSAESEELKFFTRQDLAHLVMPATQRPVVDRLLANVPPPHLE